MAATKLTAVIALCLIVGGFNIDLVNAEGTCVQCSSSDKEGGCQDEVKKDEYQNKYCNLTSEYAICLVYKIGEGDQSTTTRACTSDKLKNCAKVYETEKTLTSCYECNNSDYCNANINEVNKNITCLQCDGDANSDCAKNPDKITDTCSLDNGVNTYCVAYQYLNMKKNGSVYTYRGCAHDKSACSSADHAKTMTQCPDPCSDKKCNVQTFEDKNSAKYCMECDAEKCDMTEDTVQKMDNKTHICVVYQTGDSTNLTTSRKVAEKEFCKKLLTSDKKLQMCNECNGQLCNKDLDAGKDRSCIECSSDEDPNCADADVSKKITTTCTTDDTVKTQCVTQKYIDLTEGAYKTFRGCAREELIKDNCKNLNGDNTTTVTTLCLPCTSGGNCNAKIDTKDEAIYCLTCDNREDAACAQDDPKELTINDIKSIGDKSQTQCVSYKYFNQSEGKMKVFRGIADKDHSCAASENVSTVCNSCSSNMCNTNFGNAEVKKLCVQCEGEEGKECANLKDYTKVGIHKVDNQTQCIAYNYFDKSEGKMKVFRGIADKDHSCAASENVSTVCNSCSSNMCNTNFGNAEVKKLCVQCEGEEGKECANLKDYTKVGIHKVDNQTQCIAYNYFDKSEGKMKVFRGIADKDHSCAASENVSTVCNSCSSNMCNTNFGNAEVKKLCVQCEGEEGKECANLKDYTKVGIHKVDNQTQCIAYNYFDRTEGKMKVFRGAEENNHKCTALEMYSVCNSCSANMCNKDFGTSKVHKLCVSCKEGKDTECATITNYNNVTLCKADSESRCTAYKYYDVETNKFMVTRGCEKSCDSTKYNTICKECTDNICNIDYSDVQEHHICASCKDHADSPKSTCPTDKSNLTETTQLTVCSNKNATDEQCVAIKYFDPAEGDMMVSKTCATTKYCTNDASTNTTTACVECDGLVCNLQADLTDTTSLCLQCKGDKDSECAKTKGWNFTTGAVKTCALSDKQQCITYKYEDDKKVSQVVRDCVEKEQNCDSLIKTIKNPKQYKGTLKTCLDCKTNLCNKKMNDTLISSAMSLNVALVPLLVFVATLYYAA